MINDSNNRRILLLLLRPQGGPAGGPRGGGQERDFNPDSHLAYWNFRDQMAEDLRAKRVQPDPGALVQHAGAEYGISSADAAEWTERFLQHVSRDLTRKGTA